MIRPNAFFIVGIVIFAVAIAVADPYPYTDPTNTGGWVLYEPMSDEFDGASVDTTKWEALSWQGRMPVEHQFNNCSVSGGELILTTDLKPGATTPVTDTAYAIDAGYLQSIHNLRYGYFEVEARALDFPIVTGWWLTGGSSTYSREIDMLECGSGVPGDEYKYNCNFHTNRTPTPTGVDTTHIADPESYTLPWRMIDDYHIYGFEWDKDYCRIYIDGTLYRQKATESFKVAMRLMIGNEYNQWLTSLTHINDAIDAGALPKTYNIRYVRAWRKPDTNVTWYVDGTGGSDANSGASWAQAKATINAAINEATDGDQIWVAAGTYQEYITLHGMRNIELYGGFANGDTSLDDRDFFGSKLTTISSPPDGYEGVSLHSSEGVRLDGFVVTGAHINWSSGIQVNGPYDDNTVIANCTIAGNHPLNGSAGGIGIRDGHGGTILIENCWIHNNSALGSYPSGGAAGLLQGGSPRVIFNGCLFEDNFANEWGGAITCSWNDSSTLLKLVNCVFADNQTGANHAAIESNCGTVEIINCSFDSNTPESIRLTNWNLAGFKLQNSTITNSTTYGLYSNWSGITGSDGIVNSLFYNNGTNVYYGSAYNTEALINGLGWAGGCIVANPQYVNVSAEDYHLQASSSCIEAGVNIADSEPFDHDGRVRTVDGDCSGTATVDIGAYEFTTASYGDFAGGCDVDYSDFVVLADFWLADEFSIDIAPTPAGDGVIDENELAVLYENWLAGK